MSYRDFVKAQWRDGNSTKDSLACACIGAAGEMGEVLEPIKKHLYRDKPININDLELEVGDVLFYLQALLIHVGSGATLGDIVAKNINKLEARHGKRS